MLSSEPDFLNFFSNFGVTFDFPDTNIDLIVNYFQTEIIADIGTDGTITIKQNDFGIELVSLSIKEDTQIYPLECSSRKFTHSEFVAKKSKILINDEHKRFCFTNFLIITKMAVYKDFL